MSSSQLQQIAQDLFLWKDSCNVYVLKDGDSALLVDFGDGSVLEALTSIAVSKVEWVLFPHHHREQCQGAARLASTDAKVAVPKAERDFFENPLSYRKMRPSLSDPFTCYASSYLRPPREPIEVDHDFDTMDDFQWRGHEFWVLGTPGNSPGAVTYLLKHEDKLLAFCGDVMLDGAKMHTWFDTEWDYGYAAGLFCLYRSAHSVERFEPDLLLPSHGTIVTDPAKQLPVYRQKLKTLSRLYLRAWDKEFTTDEGDQISRPTAVPHLWQVTPHTYKFAGAGFGGNFQMILADSGHALFVDAGFAEPAWWDRKIRQMKERIGLKQIDAVIISHMHGDHILECPHLREKHGARIWTLDNTVEKYEHPERFDYTCPIQSYGGPEGIPIDRGFAPGETIEWEGYTLTFDWLPGQTEFGMCLHLTIDGRRVAFTGDNIFGSVNDSGHDAVVARNSGIFEEGYIHCAEHLCNLKPDLILAGHSVVIDNPGPQLERFGQWAYQIRNAFQALSPDENYEYFFDPFWVRAYPYRSWTKAGQRVELAIHLRNFRDREERHLIAINVPPGWQASPSALEGALDPRARSAEKVTVTTPLDATPGVYAVTFDPTLDEKRYGEWFDAIVEVG